MARRTFTPEQLQEFQRFAAQWGKIIARRAFGDDGPGLDVDLDAMEQLAHAAATGHSIRGRPAPAQWPWRRRTG